MIRSITLWIHRRRSGTPRINPPNSEIVAYCAAHPAQLRAVGEPETSVSVKNDASAETIKDRSLFLDHCLVAMERWACAEYWAKRWGGQFEDCYSCKVCKKLGHTRAWFTETWESVASGASRNSNSAAPPVKASTALWPTSRLPMCAMGYPGKSQFLASTANWRGTVHPSGAKGVN